jgi:polyhydroxybutyrate depolymerase
MKNIAKILFLLLIVGCGSDAGSKIISSSGVIDPNTGTGGTGGNNGGNNGGSTTDLNVELISIYNDDTASFSTVFGNYTRSFIVHTPPNYDPTNDPIPLLFVLHGYTGQAPSIRNYSGFDSIADEENFIVVYVQGVTDITNNTGWNVNVVSTFNEVDDVGLFSALIKYFKGNYNIADDKIFSTGMSLGGFMSYRLACELDEINSIGSVTGSMSAYYNCVPPNQKSIIHFHGTSDTVVPYNGNSWSYNVENAHSFWANYNNCQNQSEVTVPDFNGDGIYSTQLISYGCDGSREVVLYTMQDEGHTWFKKDWGHDLDTSRLIWEFFKDK